MTLPLIRMTSERMSRLVDANLAAASDAPGRTSSPELRWKGAPAGAKSYAVTVVNRDASEFAEGRYHWIAVNIPSAWTGLPRGLSEVGAGSGLLQPPDNLAERGWPGPCAAQGATPHRYVCQATA